MGILDWLQGTPESLGAPSPMTSRGGLIGAGLKDIGAMLSGQPTGNLEGVVANARASQQRNALNQKIRDAYAKGDMNAIRQALMEYSMAGGDTSHITGAMSFGQPKVMDVGGTAVSVDPFTNEVKPVYKAREKAPAGFAWGEDGKLHYIHGGPSDPSFASVLSGAKRKPDDAAPTMKKPWEMF